MVMSHFEVSPNGAGWHAASKFATAASMDMSITNVFVGLFPCPGKPAGRTRTVHAPMTFPLIMGCTTPCDQQAFAFPDDVAGGMAQMAHFTNTSFDLASNGGINVLTDVTTATVAWVADPTLDIVDEVASGTDAQSIWAPHFMCVPPQCVSLFVG